MRTRPAVTCAVALSFFGAGAARGAEPPPPRAVVFVEPAGGAVDPELRAALEAQLATSSVPLSFVRFAESLPTLREQVAAARALAAGRDVAGIFWLDDRSGDDWMLYLAEPGGDRVLVRRIEVDRGNLAAASEASAVILRDSATALLAGSTLGMQPLAVEPVPAPRPPARSAPAPRAARPPAPRAVDPQAGALVAAGLVGDWAYEQVGFEPGLRLAAGFRFANGVEIGGGAALLRTATARREGLALELSRLPIDLQLGEALRLGPVTCVVALRAVAERVDRAAIPLEPGVFGSRTEGAWDALLGARLAAQLSVTKALALEVAAAGDLALRPRTYSLRRGPTLVPLLSGRSARPGLGLGLVFRP